MTCLIYTLAANEEESDKIARHLLEARLIACVNSFPVTSKYWWKGKLETDSEIAMIMKTREELADRIIGEIRKIHSYDVPAIDVIPISKSYKELIDWLEKETTEL